MPVQAIAAPTPDEPRTGRWSWNHPLAEVAARHCRSHATLLPLLIGGVACGACWELAIRDDEQFRLECGLPRHLDVDPSYVDQVAVEQAVNGREVPLTKVERHEVRRRLHELARRRNIARRYICAVSAVTR